MNDKVAVYKDCLQSIYGIALTKWKLIRGPDIENFLQTAKINSIVFIKSSMVNDTSLFDVSFTECDVTSAAMYQRKCFNYTLLADMHLFKVNNGKGRAICGIRRLEIDIVDVILIMFCCLWKDFTHCSGFSTVEFEQLSIDVAIDFGI